MRFFRTDGSLRTIGNYHRDRKHGHWITLGPNKNTLADLRYVNGTKQGWQEYFADNGQVIRIERFDHGVPDGPLYMFFPDGKPKEETWFDKGKITGRHLRWWRSDTLEGSALMGQYALGTNDGTWYIFYGSGRKSREDNYLHNEQHGIWRRWDPEGRLVLDQLFDHGTLVRTNVDRRPKH